jgi:voltage-gated potassium channel
LALRRTFVLAAITLLLVVLGGAVVLSWIEGWDFIKSLFFTIFTVTTVGYGDEGISRWGKLFTVLLLIGGVATWSYMVAVVMQTVIAARDRWRATMQRAIDKVDGHVVIAGYGKMAREIVPRLQAVGRRVVIIDNDETKVVELRDSGVLFVEGDATHEDVLLMAGVQRATHVIAAMKSIGDNICVAISCRDLQPNLYIVARGERAEDRRRLNLAGADHVVMPLLSGAAEVVSSVVRPGMVEVLEGELNLNVDVALARVLVLEGSMLDGMRLHTYGSRYSPGVCFVALERDGETMLPPRGHVVLQTGDELLVTGEADQVSIMYQRGRSKDVVAKAS